MLGYLVLRTLESTSKVIWLWGKVSNGTQERNPSQPVPEVKPASGLQRWNLGYKSSPGLPGWLAHGLIRVGGQRGAKTRAHLAPGAQRSAGQGPGPTPEAELP